MKDVNNAIRRLLIDQFINISGVIDFQASKITGNSFVIPYLLRVTNDNSNCVFQHLYSLGEFLWKVENGWVMAYNSSNGNLYGMSNIITHNLETKFIKFRDTDFNLLDSKIYQEGNGMIIENNVVNATLKIKLNNSNGFSELLINEFMNITGINDISLSGKIVVSNSVTHRYVNGNYTIDNRNNGSNLLIKNYDDNGNEKVFTIDKYINITGTNDFYCNRLFINNSLINFDGYNGVLNNTQQNEYSSYLFEKTLIGTLTDNIVIIPKVPIEGAYYFIVHTNDNFIVLTNDNVIVQM
jgi:hypothetical protein